MYKIYRIIDNTNGNIYIGKTEEKYLSTRLAKHKYDKDCMSCQIINNGDYKIELIEETDDDMRERYWILNTNCINKNIPGRTSKEYYQDNREKKKKYYDNNKEKKLQYQKNLNKYTNSWGGDPRSNNNLLKIDINLFL